MSAVLVARLLANPASAARFNMDEWTAALTAARAERLLPALAARLDGLLLPEGVQRVLDAATADCEVQRVQALWEVEMCRRALAPLDVPVVLLKGSAFVAAGLDAGRGRLVGDLDILVPRDRLDEVEAALLDAGWDWVKPDPYDDAYYRRWMHELPPLIHRDRDRIIDVHHTILPLTARPKPDAAALIADSVALENGLRVLCPEDMIVHAAAHLFADGDLSGGLRNLWDIDHLLREFEAEGFEARMLDRAKRHQLRSQVERALRLRHHLFVTPAKAGVQPLPRQRRDPGLRRGDGGYAIRLLARNGWGRPTRPMLRFVFYLRSHLIRMPLRLLVPHLWTKWRKGLEAR